MHALERIGLVCRLANGPQNARIRTRQQHPYCSCKDLYSVQEAHNLILSVLRFYFCESVYRC